MQAFEAAQPLEISQPPRLSSPPRNEVHVHVHGLSSAEAGEAIRQATGDGQGGPGGHFPRVCAREVIPT